MIEPRNPANGMMRNVVISHTPMKAPTMPITMFQMSPYPKPAHDLTGQPSRDGTDNDHDDNAVYPDHYCLPGD